MTLSMVVVWAVVCAVGAAVACAAVAIGVIYLVDYIIEWNNNRPRKLAKRYWDYTERWEDLRFELMHIRTQLVNPVIRYRIKMGRLDHKEG